MDFESYSSFWNQQASTDEGALAAVDGSASEEIVRLTGGWTADQVRLALALDGRQRVLELGCGVGRIGRELAGDCRSWVGTDISANMLEVARERLADLDNVSFQPLHRTSLDMFESASFDRVYTVAVLCHMDKEDLFLYLQELRRLLNEDGIAYLETWNLAHPMGWKRWQFEVNNWKRSDQSQRKNVARNQFCTPDEFELYVREAGFQVVRSWADSPWIQVIAVPAGAGSQVAAQQERIDPVSQRIAYSRQWGELFGQLLDVIYGLRAPGDLLAALDQMPAHEEVALYRAYLVALWRQGQAHWGALPPEVEAEVSG
ncbi:MAG: class I SAM-dependent methyltransferase [Xanthomonadales bacterium]|nr:class I SAM-dependent methyltransferase [Xanthomonadales bacterium]